MVQDTKVHGPVWEPGRLPYGCDIWADAGRIWQYLTYDLGILIIVSWATGFSSSLAWLFVKSETDGTAWQIGTWILKPNCLGL